MDSASLTVRRANLDDLTALQALWEVSRFPALDLEKRLTEFQVALRPDGVLTGAMGLFCVGVHGWLHHEAYYSTHGAALARPALWTRMLALARSQGLARLWMSGSLADFWREKGFVAAEPAQLARLPAGFGSREANWQTLPLHDEALLNQSLQRQLEVFHEAEHARVEQLRRRAKLLKGIALLIAASLFLAALWLLTRVLHVASHRPH